MKFARRKVGVSWQETQTFMAGNSEFAAISQYSKKGTREREYAK